MQLQLTFETTEDAAKYTLAELADRINGCREQIGHGLRYSVMQVVQSGAYLTAAKNHPDMKHGQWLPWLAENCPEITDRTARRYMGLYDRAKKNRTLMSDLTPTQAYKQLGIIKEKKDRVSIEKETFLPEDFIEPDYRIGDFRDVLADVPDESAHLLLTDPPYGEKALPLYAELGRFAARVLKSGGSLLTYCGQATLPKVLTVLSESLRYWWVLCLEHTGSGQQLPGKWVYVKWKPIAWFVKDNRQGRRYVVDRLHGDEPDKERLEWAQGVSEVRHLIEQLTGKGDLILDPFAGTGRWGELAGRMGRRWIGSDLQAGGGLNL